MIYIRWRILISNLLHHFVLLLAILVFLWAIFLSILRTLFVLLPQHETIITDILSPIIGAPITFGKMETDWHHVSPEFVLSEVKIWNSEHKVLMTIPEVTIRLDLLSSLLNRQPELGLLQINGWRLRIYQDENQRWQVAGIESLSVNNPSSNQEVGLNNMLHVMKLIHHLRLVQNEITFEPRDRSAIHLSNLNLDWHSDGDSLHLYGNTRLDGFGKTKLLFASELKGEDVQDLTGRLYVKFSPTDLRPLLLKKSWKHFVWDDGLVGGEAWGDWEKDHWQGLAASLKLAHLDIHETQEKNPWVINVQKARLKIKANFSDKKDEAQFSLESEPGSVVFGNIFRSPMPYQQLSLEGGFEHQASGESRLFVNPVHLVTSDADTWSWVQASWSPKNEPEMTLVSRAHLNNLENVSHNLPAGVMPGSVVSWLDHSILDGDASDAEMLWRGPLAHFPFDDQSGTMQIYGKVNHVALNYAPHWPAIGNLDADLFFTSHGMHIDAKAGVMSGLSLAGASVDIPEFKNGAHLIIQDHLKGEFQEAWEYLANTPLKEDLSGLLNALLPKGPFDLGLKIDLPLSSPELVQYAGVLNLDDNKVLLKTPQIALDGVSGQLMFSDKNIEGKNLKANWMGQTWNWNIATKGSKTTVNFSGIAPLQAWLTQKFSSIAKWIHGSGFFTGSVIFDRGNHDFGLELNSSLKGVALHLPLGQEKNADIETPFKFKIFESHSVLSRLELSLPLPKAPLFVRTTNGVWVIDTPSITGRVLPPGPERDAWVVNLSPVDLRQFKDLDTSGMSNDQLPAINLNLSRLTLPSGMFFPHAELQLQPREGGGQMIKKLVLNHQDFQLTAQGFGDGQLTHLNGQLTAPDLDAAVEALGLPNIAEASKVAANFDLTWPARLWDFSRDNLRGHLKLSTGAGVFEDVSHQTANKINLGRMLDILSLSELPSHLTSKFNDMTQKGFPFNQVNGEMDLSPAQINQLNVKISGPVADVLLKGCIDVGNKKLNLIAEINPKLTGSLPVLATLAGGPILGAIGFVANEVLAPAVGKLSASYYAITGSEDAPKTSKVDSLTAKQLIQACPAN